MSCCEIGTATICHTMGHYQTLWLVLVVLVCYITVHSRKHRQFVHRTPAGQVSSAPNILLILADDLGYGDTNVPPFVGLGIKTPSLEKMASKGMKLTNYHTAAATCTPTRASILTGMYPWRLGIKSVFEYGKPHGQSNRNDWLTPVPTIPMVLHEANYSVTHSGKWHLGGMRNDDLDMRQLPVKPPGQPGGRRCPHPGPNQQGFKNYVSVLDGPGSPRQNRLQLSSHLYSEGCTALLHNDEDIGSGAHNVTGYLTYCEAEHAIQAMKRSVSRHKPFYVQLWFHAPHSPLEEIPGWFEKLTGNASSKPLENQDMFRTMVADMDHQIGRVLDSLESMGIEQNTLVVFTSDNGPEPFAGSRAGLKGAKRYLYEGGIRVPAIVQWTGTIPAGQSSDAFVMSTDLFPTFLDAAGVLAPPHLRLDGLSILPLIVPDYYKDHSGHAPAATAAVPSVPVAPVGNTPTRHAVDAVRLDEPVYRAAMRDRVTLWHNDYEGQRRTAAWVYGYKVILDENERMIEMYDVDTNMYEARNLAAHARPSPVPQDIAIAGTVPGTPPSGKAKVTLEMVLTQRGNAAVHALIATRLTAVMVAYVHHGSDAHKLQKQANPGWNYPPTLRSDMRADLARGRESPQDAEASHYRLTNGTCGTTPCSCEVKVASEVPSLPFELTNALMTYLQPGKLLNAAQLLGL